MSAAGISMFYAGLDLATAKAEVTANLDSASRKYLTAGTWTNTQPLRVLDLSRLPSAPHFYDQRRYYRDQLLFLKNFVEDITQPVSHDGHEHIDYVPTQILTEYFRLRYKADDDNRLHAIIYPSAQRRRGRSIVIFTSHKELNPRPDGWPRPEPPILELDTASIRRVTRP